MRPSLLQNSVMCRSDWNSLLHPAFNSPWNCVRCLGLVQLSSHVRSDCPRPSLSSKMILKMVGTLLEISYARKKRKEKRKEKKRQNLSTMTHSKGEEKQGEAHQGKEVRNGKPRQRAIRGSDKVVVALLKDGMWPACVVLVQEIEGNLGENQGPGHMRYLLRDLVLLFLEDEHVVHDLEALRRVFQAQIRHELLRHLLCGVPLWRGFNIFGVVRNGLHNAVRLHRVPRQDGYGGGQISFEPHKLVKEPHGELFHRR